MKQVADHLAKKAVECVNSIEMDLFARSAFNRYYYACFHAARSIVGEVSPKSKSAPHKAYQEDILTEKVYNSIKLKADNSKKKNLIDSATHSRIISSSKLYLHNLKDLLKIAYQCRILADYDLDVKVLNVDGRLQLEKTTLHNAQNWIERAETLRGGVMREWKRI